jgi:nucleoid-associated protein YgaU
MKNQEHLKKMAPRFGLMMAIALLSMTLSSCSSSKNLSDNQEGDDAEASMLDDSAATDNMPENAEEGIDTGTTDAAATSSDIETPSEPPVVEEPPAMDVAASPVVEAPPVMQAPEEEAAPAPSAPMVSAGEGNESGARYTVQRGDTLMKIAFATYGDIYRWKEIYEANRDKINNPNIIEPNTVLSLPGAGSAPASTEGSGEKYLIQQGDTLAKISAKVYGTSAKWKKIYDNNQNLIRNPNKIYAGFYLYYTPDEGGAPIQEARNTYQQPAPMQAPVETQAAEQPMSPPAEMPPVDDGGQGSGDISF